MNNEQTCNCQEEVSEEQLLAQPDDILLEYEGKPGALIPILQITQKMFGYLPKDALKIIASKLNKS